MLISGITPEELLDIAHNASIFWGSHLCRSESLVPLARAFKASPSRAVGVQMLVAFFLQRQLQKQHNQVLISEGPCLALRRCPTFIPHALWDEGHKPE